MAKIIASVSWLCVAVSTALAEPLSKQAVLEKEKYFYSSYETLFKQDYDRRVAVVMEDLKESGRLNTLPKRELDGMLDFAKFLVYNRANEAVTCIGDALRSGASEDIIMSHGVSECVEARYADFMIWTKLVDMTYVKVLPPGATVRCEMEARLFERELQLPPYEFLKGKDVVLLDFRKYNGCLKASGKN